MSIHVPSSDLMRVHERHTNRNENMAAVVAELNQILEWIGFDVQNDRNAIMNDAFMNYADVLALKEKDITSFSDSYSRRTIINGRINFGLRRTKKLQAFLHWTKDFIRVSMAPTIGVLTQDEFLDSLTVTTKRCDVRKMMNDQSDQKSKEASPGHLVSEKKWPEWQPKFDTYLSIILGVEGVPLSYVTRS